MSMVDVRVVDPDGNDCPVGEVGEIVVQGDQVTKGYFGNPEATAEAFRGGWFHTGDLARMDEEGFLYIVDRSKDMIITGGENVYSSEVENAIYEHPGVLQAAVIGMPDERWGEMVDRGHRPQAGRRGHRGRDRRPVPQPARVVQAPPQGDLHRRAPPDRQRQDPQERPPRPGHHPRALLTSRHHPLITT